jgi:hypothetical protein
MIFSFGEESETARTSTDAALEGDFVGEGDDNDLESQLLNFAAKALTLTRGLSLTDTSVLSI